MRTCTHHRCMHTHSRTHIHAHTYTGMHTLGHAHACTNWGHTHVYTWGTTHICTHWAHSHMHTLGHTHTCTNWGHTHMYTWVTTHIWIHTHTHTHVHTGHTHTHTYTLRCSLKEALEGLRQTGELGPAAREKGHFMHGWFQRPGPDGHGGGVLPLHPVPGLFPQQHHQTRVLPAWYVPLSCGAGGTALLADIILCGSDRPLTA